MSKHRKTVSCSIHDDSSVGSMMALQLYSDSVAERLSRWKQLEEPDFVSAGGAAINGEIALLVSAGLRISSVPSLQRMSQIEDTVGPSRLIIAAAGIVQVIEPLSGQSDWRILEQDRISACIVGKNSSLSASIMRALMGKLQFLAPIAHPYLLAVCAGSRLRTLPLADNEMPHRGLAYLVCVVCGTDIPDAPQAKAECLAGLANWQAAGISGADKYMRQILTAP